MTVTRAPIANRGIAVDQSETDQNKQATVFVVDDDEAMTKSIRWLIETVGLKVKTFGQGKEFLESYQSGDPGCLILDVRMPGISGLELQGLLKEHHINLPIIFITGHGDVPMAIKAMKAGAFEFLTKPFNDQTLLDSINQAIEFDGTRRQENIELDSIIARVEKLTPREREVMDLVVEGKLNKVIADELYISAKTVELHRAKIMEKMQAASLAHLVRLVLAYRQYRDRKD
ncbi:MAG: response regulator transcription factor [Gammaproteobacteria bacterium]|nr:response regulator transcription factor [Gammaproteobacteria bacterium]